MGWVDQIPRTGKLYIGGLGALFQTEIVERAGITHVLSIIDYEIDARQLNSMKHMHIQAEDIPSENLLEYFEKTNVFIEEALRNQGGVFVHCAMGKSRSATIVCAYLMWKYGLSPLQALGQVCEGRPVCQPNIGFMEQLAVYHDSLAEKDEQAKEQILQRWERTRFQGNPWEWDTRSIKPLKENL